MSIYLQSARRRAVAAAPTDAERALRVQLAAAYRIFDHLGWVEMIFNHITVRVPGDETLFLINPFGLHYREVTASNLVLIDIEGNPVRESQWPINRA
ncbi:MAG: class II aldolase/adducin family protein, partial [Burkholderiales bacterium]